MYFELLDRSLLHDTSRMTKVFRALRFIHDDDTAAEKKFFLELFSKLVELLGRPFGSSTFNFADKNYFDTLFAFGEELAGMKELRKSKKARGVRDALYINRTYFGLYSLLHELKAEIKIKPEIRI